MPREMLKLRKGDAAIMIKKDGKIEMAGIDNKPLVDEKGMISPVILFAAAWVTKDKTLSAQFEHTVGVTNDGFEIFTKSKKNYEQPPYSI